MKLLLILRYELKIVFDIVQQEQEGDDLVKEQKIRDVSALFLAGKSRFTSL